MTSNKKYHCQIRQGKTGWTAEIIRRVTSKRTAVSKSQDGFATEAEAKAWCEKELESFLANLGERNKRDSAQRTKAQNEKTLRDEAYQLKKKELEMANAKTADTKEPDPEGPDK